jgi:hypothetical protein
VFCRAFSNAIPAGNVSVTVTVPFDAFRLAFNTNS